jgi:hypothetical protein
VYYITQFTADMIFYAILNVPSSVMVLLGYRHDFLPYVPQGLLFGIDVLTKFAFGCILLPIVYLIGFAQRENAENVYKSLGVILYLIGHLFNMVILSIIGYITT